MRGCVMIGQRIPCNCDATCTIHDARCGKRVGAHRAGLIAMGAITLTIRESDLLFRHAHTCGWAQRTTAQRHRRCGSPLPFEGAHTLALCAATPFPTHQTQIVRCSPALPPTCTDARTHSSQPPVRVSDSGITRTRSRSYIEGVGFQVHGHER